jgi:hypothetical protein
MLIRFCSFTLVTFFVFQCIGIKTVAMAEGISWTLKQRSQTTAVATLSQADTLRIAVTKQQTQVISCDEILFIDYAEMHLYRLDRPSGKCSVFDLKETDSPSTGDEESQDQKISTQMTSFLAEFSVKESSEQRVIKELRCVKKSVLMGAGMFRFKTVVPKVIERYGQFFSETVAEYWVSRDVAVWQTLQRVVQHRQAAFKRVPLLRRIDPLGFIDIVGGFPVQGWEKSGGNVVELILVSGPATGVSSLQLPQECTFNFRAGSQ